MMFPKINPAHKRRVPKQKKRNEFGKVTRERIMNVNDHICKSCGKTATQIHHVFPKGRGGRGVYTNGMPVCNDCHDLIHRDNTMLDYWIDVYRNYYGRDFYKDQWD